MNETVIYAKLLRIGDRVLNFHSTGGAAQVSNVNCFVTCSVTHYVASDLNRIWNQWRIHRGADGGDRPLTEL